MHIRTTAATTITAIAVIVFVTTLARATLYAPTETTAPGMSPAAHNSGAPQRLRVPSLGIDAAVQQVGIAQSGNMAVPTNYTDVGWYRGGVLPGRVGSAVFDGHVDDGLGSAAVFARIGTLKPGSEIVVQTASSTFVFVVEEVATYPKDNVPLERLFNRADRPRLNLITCEGEWLPGAKTYDHRIVVYAVLKNTTLNR